MVDAFLNLLQTDSELSPQLVGWHRAPAEPGSYAPFPESVPEELRWVLEQRGVRELYAHQERATRHVAAGRHTVVVTPTASGKSLCYNLPVLSALLSAGPAERPSALYLFPTKALSQDQVAELNELLGLVEARARPAAPAPTPTRDPIAAYTYDGDTPGNARRVLRERGDLIVTNPYMLHVAILPNHLRWGAFFRRLRYVVIDELHVYQGIFGSSVANVIRRLRRIARHYGSDPVFIASSATIRNPGRHFERLVEASPAVVDRSGAPRAERHHLFYNPPVVNEALGIRSKAVDEVRTLARHLLRQGVPTLVFGRTRSTVEVLTKYLKDAARELRIPAERVVGYRGGYLPRLRRSIERGLRAGEISMVAATNALELGVDIGALDAVLMTGYPGSVASYHQQCGRAGRRSGKAVSVLVGSSLPLDQYVLAHPQGLLSGSEQETVANPDNLVIATSHLKCAAFELPFHESDAFGHFPHGPEVLDALAAPGGVLLKRDRRFHWMAPTYPAEEVSLDAVEADSFLVLDRDHGTSLGHVDRPAAITSLHPQAIYQHQGMQYQVKELDWEGRRAHVEKVAVDYYTDAETETDIQVLQEDGGTSGGGAEIGFGDVHVSVLATLFKKIRFYTNENLETGPITLPPEEFDTTAFWLVINPELQERCRLSESTRAGVVGALAHLFRGLAPVFLGLGARDLKGRGFASHAHFERPVVMLYDGVPGGVGLAPQLFGLRAELIRAAQERLRACRCRRGCPSCIGLGESRGAPAKRAAMDLLGALDASLARGELAGGALHHEESACP